MSVANIKAAIDLAADTIEREVAGPAQVASTVAGEERNILLVTLGGSTREELAEQLRSLAEVTENLESMSAQAMNVVGALRVYAASL